MEPVYNLRASTNSTFRWTLDFSALAQAAANLATATIRMQARLSASASDCVYEWVSKGSTKGTITFNGATGLCVFLAPESDMRTMPRSLYYDCVLELSEGGVIKLFGGRIFFSVGVTRGVLGTTEGVPGDTVFPDGGGGSTPMVLPVLTSTAIAAAIVGMTDAQKQAVFTALLLALSPTPPSEAGRAWLDGQFAALS